MFANWLHHIQKANITNFIVIVTDEAAYSRYKHIPQVFFHPDFQHDTGIFHFRDDNYQKIVMFIYETVTWGMSWGYDVLMCDSDIVVLHNPFTAFARLPPCDILISSGAPSV